MEQEVSMDSTSVDLNEENVENEIHNIRDVEDNVEEPKIGMLFDSIEELMEFYTRYGKEKGFAVSKRTSKKGDDGEMRYMTIACSRNGKSHVRSSNPLRSNPTSKTDCKAKIRASICLDGKWRVSSLVLNHNHETSPEKSRFYKCNRILNPLVRKRCELNDRLPCITPYEMEKQFQSAYTTTKFKEFQQELTGKICCSLSSSKEGTTISEYDVGEDVHFGDSHQNVTFKVSLNNVTFQVNCNCCLFEFRGILCRHTITVLIHKRIFRVPDTYIFKKWCKDAERNRTKVRISYENWSNKPEGR